MRTTPGLAGTTPAATYDAVADASAALVLRSYSSSFSLATRLLAEPVRTDVSAVYAMVRLADEIVDAPREGVSAEESRRVLDELEGEVRDGVRRGQSANLVVHAFARTARRCGITDDLVAPFFASMRTDLQRTRHDPESFAAYVYGSAEVVGLMCLRAFLVAEPDPERAYDALAPGAQRLGAAFQKLNFLRDLAEDEVWLGRTYFPGVEVDSLTDTHRDALLAEIVEDLRVAGLAVDRLPASSRRAVRLAHALFSELARRIGRTPAPQLRRRRVRVPGPVKARIAAAALLGQVR